MFGKEKEKGKKRKTPVHLLHEKYIICFNPSSYR